MMNRKSKARKLKPCDPFKYAIAGTKTGNYVNLTVFGGSMIMNKTEALRLAAAIIGATLSWTEHAPCNFADGHSFYLTKSKTGKLSLNPPPLCRKKSKPQT